VTKEPQTVESGRCERRESVELTPEMIERATRVLWQSGRLTYEAPGADQLLVKKMLESALSHSSPDIFAKTQ
jgi:hypothetical protein